MKSRRRDKEEQEIKQYLKQVREMKIDLDGKLEEGRQIEELTKSIKEFHLEKRDGKKSDISDQMVKLEKVKEDIGRMLAEYVEKREEVKRNIEKIRDKRQRNILYSRYILLKDWESIADQCHYALRWVFQQHKNGLQELKEIIKMHKET